MLGAIFKNELKFWLKNWSSYIYFGAFFVLSLATMAGFSGVLGPGSVDAGSVSNSPFSIYTLVKWYGKLLLVVVPAIVGHSFYREYKSENHSILFSFPIKKVDYLLGKFLSSFLLVSLIGFAIALGFGIGASLPWVQAEHVLPFSMTSYLVQFAFLLLPNLFFVSLVVATVVVYSRNIFAGFLAVIFIFILIQIFQRLSGTFESPFFTSLLDPFGEFSTAWSTREWTSEMKNRNALPFDRTLIINRVLWIGMSLLAGAIAYFGFAFEQHPFRLNRKKKAGRRVLQSRRVGVSGLGLSQMKFDYSFVNQLKSTWSLARTDFWLVVKSRAFIGISTVAALLVLVMIAQMNAPYGSKVIPRTWIMLAFPVFFFGMFIHLLTFIFAGVLVHRSKTSKMDALVDISPFPNWVLILSKILALVGMQILLLLGTMLTCMSFQAFSAYYIFDIGLYITSLFGIHLLGFVIWALVSVFVHSLIPNLYIGLFVLVFAFFGLPNLSKIGVDSSLFIFSQTPVESFTLNFSELAGFGHNLTVHLVYKFYWLLLAIVFYFLTLLVWVRGLPSGIIERFSIISERSTKPLISALLFFVVCFASTGYMLRKMEVAGEGKLTKKQISIIKTKSQDKYEARYHFYPQPRIAKIDMEIDVFPHERKLAARGNYKLVNRTDASIDTLLVSYGGEYAKSYSLNYPSQIHSQDSLLHFDVLALSKPLLPGDSLEIEFTSTTIPNTLVERKSHIEKNGSYIVGGLGLEIGYYTDTSDLTVHDTLALGNHYRSIDADYVDMDMIVSTSEDQTIVASGNLEREWKDGNRSYFKYASNDIATRDFAIISGRFELTSDKWNGIPIEIYHDPRHKYNVQRIIYGIKKTMEYHYEHFGDYQHEKIKVAEFARSAGNYVQAFAGLLAWSEINMIHDPNVEDGIDLPFAGAAHELGHLWWGHQVIPADIRGARLMTEGMAEYISAQLIRHEDGRDAQNLFMNRQRRTYFRHRIGESKTERPLMYNRGLSEGHVAYQKGSLVLKTMSDMLGEDQLNDAIASYYRKVRLTGPPYSTSEDFLDHIRRATPDTLDYLITDLFETVTIHKAQISSVKQSAADNGGFELEANFEYSKFRDGEPKLEAEERVDPQGFEDYVEVAIYQDKTLLRSEYLKFTSSSKSMIWNLSERATHVVIDPNFQLIENDRKDNRLKIE